MAQPIKLLALAIAVVFALLLALVAVLLSLDPNSFRDDLRRLAAEQAGLHLDIRGDLDWQFWPRISLGVEDASAAWLTADGGTRDTLAELQALRLDAALLPLLSLSPALEITGIHLEAPRLNLIQYADGSNNWEPPATPGSAPDGASADTAAEGSSSTPPALSVLRASINNASLVYEDRATNTGAELTDLDLEAGLELLPLQVPVSLHFALAAPEQASGDLALELRQSDGGYSLNDLRGDGSWTPAGGSALAWSLAGNLAADPAGTVTIANLRAALAGVALELSGSASAAALDLAVALPASNPTPLLQAFAPDLPDPGPLAVSLQIRGTPQALALDDIRLQLPGGTWTGTAQLALPTDGPASATAALATERLDVPAILALLPAEAETSAPADGNQDPAALAALPLLPVVVSDLPAWDVRLAIADLQLPDQLAMGGFAMHSRHDTRRLDLDVSAQQLFGGNFATTMAITELAGEPRWEILTKAGGIQSRALLAWLGQTPDVDGAFAANGRYTARGRSLGDLLDTANGSFQFDGGTGAINLARFKQQILGIAALAGKSERIQNWPDLLDYQRLTGKVTLDGVDNQQLELRLDNLEADATGGIAWRAGTMDYKAFVVFQDDPRWSSFDVNDYLIGIRFPMRCQGPLDAEGLCTVDREAMNQVIADILTGRSNKAVQERLDRAVEEKVPEEYRDAAKGLLDMLRRGGKGG